MHTPEIQAYCQARQQVIATIHLLTPAREGQIGDLSHVAYPILDDSTRAMDSAIFQPN